MFLNNSVDSVPTVYLIFVDDMLNVSEDGYDWGKQYSLACTSTSLGRVSSRPIALPDHFFCFRCGRGHDSRSGDPDKLLLLILMEKTIYWRCRCRTEEPPLGGPEPQLRPPYGVKWATRHLFKYTPRHEGPEHFRDQFENLHDDSVNWTPYSAYHDDLP
jgi:hypothetical protein